MTIYAIDHILITMPAGKEERARRFYSQVLGLNEVPKPPALAKQGGVWFKKETVKLHLGVDPNFKPARKAHPALLVKDLNSLLARCQEAGYQVDTSQPPLDGYLRGHVSDPFGNRIELMERLSV